ncbi:M48 family metalloprotease [Jannaschia rubra]|uniref:Putative Zn-dependent protease n=1 Tax=Jannaschia rubra TaxID=282197 RepID=A0A0M6XPU8_9RHOB|nr:M48 family metalloprotease [Jannaschia rubra]CTQ32165.1 Putative Zn-dependent protease [Jannaschia rubra]SFG36135.1 Peptidase family M48 [Jannaschia rubra]
MPARFALRACALAATLMLAACGTTYQLADIDPDTSGRASAMFQAAASQGVRKPASDAAARARFARVVARIRPVAEGLCRQELAGRRNVTCGVDVGVDTKMKVRNAYFTYADPAKQRPMVMVTVPLLRDVANEDELAFVLGHEYGHLIGQHIQKGEQQAVAGALIMGAIAAAATADNPYANHDQIISDSMNIGGALGGRAFSQTYELESDTLGTLITRQAGYDPVKGARYFARPAEAKSVNGELSFWGTHPPDEVRLATVMATVAQIETQGGIGRKAAP